MVASELAGAAEGSCAMVLRLDERLRPAIGRDATAEVEAVLVAASRDPQLPKPTLLLIDTRDSEMTHSFTDVSKRLSLIRQHTRAPFVAFVVSGVARERLAQIYRRRGEVMGTHIEVFPDLQGARAWLVDTTSPQR
jgi:hypothetical protein